MRGKITKRAVDAIKPVECDVFMRFCPDWDKQLAYDIEPVESDLFLWDTELKGFGLKVTPAGGKVYVVQYRTGGRGKPVRRYTIGRHGSPWTPEAARREALRLLGEVAEGTDPAAEKKKKRQKGKTVAELCDEYVAEGCATKKSGTIANDRSRIERHIKPLLGRKLVSEVTRDDVKQLLRDVAEGKTATDEKTGPRGRAIVTGGKGVANRVIETLGSIFTFAVDQELRSDNPARGITKFKGRTVDKFLSTADLAQLGDALSAAERNGENKSAIAAIRLLALTGCRKSEILGRRWQDVDFEHSVLHLSDSKTGARTVSLGAPALKLLSELPRMSEYVIPGDNPNRPLVGLAKVWRRIIKAAGLEGWRIHDLRHAFGAAAASAGNSLLIVGKVLGHERARSTEIYAHVGNDPIRAVAGSTSETIASALSGSKEADVLPMKRRR